MFQPLSISDQPVEQVNVFKYFGTEMDTSLIELHTRSVLRKATTITQDPTHPLNQSFQ